MAKARDIAALAGLAGLAYANRDKLFGSKDTKGKEDTGPGYKSTETREDKAADEGYKNDVLKTITQKREASNDKAGNQGVLSPKSLTPEVKPKALSKPTVDNTTAAAIPSGIMGGARQRTSTVSSSAEGMKNYKPRRTPPSARSPGDEMSETAKKYKRPTLMKEGGMTASNRADGIATKGKTRGKIC